MAKSPFGCKERCTQCTAVCSLVTVAHWAHVCYNKHVWQDPK